MTKLVQLLIFLQPFNLLVLYLIQLLLNVIEPLLSLPGIGLTVLLDLVQLSIVRE